MKRPDLATLPAVAPEGAFHFAASDEPGPKLAKLLSDLAGGAPVTIRSTTSLPATSEYPTCVRGVVDVPDQAGLPFVLPEPAISGTALTGGRVALNLQAESISLRATSTVAGIGGLFQARQAGTSSGVALSLGLKAKSPLLPLQEAGRLCGLNSMRLALRAYRAYYAEETKEKGLFSLNTHRSASWRSRVQE
jgi:hypothetical protein